MTWLAVGDMRMRTMHSLGYALSQFDCPITFVSPPDMSLTDEFKAELKQFSVNFREAEHVEQAIAEADVILVEPVVQPDYTKSRDERTGNDVGLPLPTTRSRANCSRRKPNRMRSCCIPCRAWTRCQPTWTSPAGRAIGRKRSTEW